MELGEKEDEENHVAFEGCLESQEKKLHWARGNGLSSLMPRAQRASRPVCIAALSPFKALPRGGGAAVSLAQ